MKLNQIRLDYKSTKNQFKLILAAYEREREGEGEGVGQQKQSDIIWDSIRRSGPSICPTSK